MISLVVPRLVDPLSSPESFSKLFRSALERQKVEEIFKDRIRSLSLSLFAPCPPALPPPPAIPHYYSPTSGGGPPNYSPTNSSPINNSVGSARSRIVSMRRKNLMGKKTENETGQIEKNENETGKIEKNENETVKHEKTENETVKHEKNWKTEHYNEKNRETNKNESEAVDSDWGYTSKIDNSSSYRLILSLKKKRWRMKEIK
jgi:hypothetical protein